MLRPPPISTLFPYTTLFRSSGLKPKGKGKQQQVADAIAPHLLEQAILLRREVPGRSITQIIQILEWEGKAEDRKSTRLNSSHVRISYAVFCLKKKNKTIKR